jgi:mono/diheme cytochrome c family protein
MRRVAGVVLLVAVAGVADAAGNRRPSDAERGRELYERHCQSCHGAGARGDGPASADLVAPVPDVPELTEDGVGAQVELVLLGRESMPGFEASFDRYDARRVLRHMARVRAKPAQTGSVHEAPPPTADPGVLPAVEAPPSLRRKASAADTDGAPPPVERGRGPE